MLWSDFFFAVFRFFISPVLICTLWLYFYPFLHDCSFPVARPGEAACMIPGQEKAAIATERAPFRLLALADPQLEGDTSLPDPHRPSFPSLWTLGDSVRDDGWTHLPARLPAAVKGAVVEDLPALVGGYKKRLDLWGNDLYLAHVYRSVSWWTDPTHAVVLGDLLGSQWIKEREFARRTDRFWNRVFNGATRVPRNITGVSGRVERLGEDRSWKRRLIAVPGNHDIGYAGDLTEDRIRRFEEAYGDVNWEIRFRVENESTSQTSSLSGHSLFDATPELRVIVLNSMNLDEPAWSKELQQQSRDYVAEQLHSPKSDTSKTTATVLLTHIPLYKRAGICTDAPFFDYFPEHHGGGIREQNHLSEMSSNFILDGLAGPKKNGKAIVLNGHDHDGCDTYHSRSKIASQGEDQSWSAQMQLLAAKQPANESMAGVREITVRSMMGSYGGNVGFLSAWFDQVKGEWRFQYSSCRFWVQHVWWAVHIFDLVWLSIGLAGVIAFGLEIRAELKANWAEEEKLKKA